MKVARQALPCMRIIKVKGMQGNLESIGGKALNVERDTLGQHLRGTDPVAMCL